MQNFKHFPLGHAPGPPNLCNRNFKYWSVFPLIGLALPVLVVLGNIKWQLKGPSHAKLSTSSPISEKPISSNLFSLLKHGHGQLGNHIIMVPLRILMCFFKTLLKENSNVSEFIEKLFNNSNIPEVKAWQVDTLWKILTKNWWNFSSWSKLIQNAPLAIKISGGDTPGRP